MMPLETVTAEELGDMKYTWCNLVHSTVLGRLGIGCFTALGHATRG